MPRRVSMLDLARAGRNADETDKSLKVSVSRWMRDSCHRGVGHSDYTCTLHINYGEWAVKWQEPSVCSRQAFETALEAEGHEIVDGSCIGVTLNSGAIATEGRGCRTK